MGLITSSGDSLERSSSEVQFGERISESCKVGVKIKIL